MPMRRALVLLAGTSLDEGRLVCPNGENGSIQAVPSGNARCFASLRPGDAIVCIAPSPGSGHKRDLATALSVDEQDGISNWRSRQSGSPGDPHPIGDSPYPLRTHQQPVSMSAWPSPQISVAPMVRARSAGTILMLEFGMVGEPFESRNCFIEFLFDLARISVACCKKDTDFGATALTQVTPSWRIIIVSPLQRGYVR